MITNDSLQKGKIPDGSIYAIRRWNKFGDFRVLECINFAFQIEIQNVKNGLGPKFGLIFCGCLTSKLLQKCI